MFRNEKKERFGVPLFVVLMLVLATLACGGEGEVSPTKVGEVASPVPTEASAPTDTPVPLIQGDPQVFVLTITDMPSGFSADAENTGATSNEYIASTRTNPEEALAQLQEWGRINGYQAAYAKSGFDALVGTAMIQNWVSIFQSLDGAHAYFEDIEDTHTEAGLTLSPVSMPALADESKAYKIVRVTGQGESQAEWTTFLVVFRKHNVVAGIFTTATSGTAVFDDALNFAQMVESRIQWGEVEPAATKAPEEAPAPTDTPVPPAPTAYKIGDVISIGDMVMVVLGWDSPLGDEFNKPDEGKKFVAIDVLLVNQGSAATSVSTMLQMSLKDATAQKYDVDLAANIATGSSSPDGEISPGERMRGKVGFQVPQDATGLVFVFDASIFGTGKVFVELGPEPISIEPPAQLAGEQKQAMFAIGDIVEIGDLTLTINEVTFPPGDEFNKPEAGNKFVIVDVTLENKGAEAKGISSMMQMHLKDATGQKYDFDFSASMASGGTTPDGELAPGEKMRGQVGFQVPENAQGLVFVFDADVFGYGKVFVALP